MSKKKPKDDAGAAIIFIADGFDEAFAVDQFCQLRQQGVSVLFVGNKRGVISGKLGLEIRPNITITELTSSDSTQAASCCIPGDLRCANAILTDPRVLNWLRAGEKEMLLAPEAKKILNEIGIQF